MQTIELPEKNDNIRGRRLTDAESSNIAIQDPQDISELEEWFVSTQTMSPKRLEEFENFFRNK